MRVGDVFSYVHGCCAPCVRPLYYFVPQDRQINPLTNISINLKKASPIEVPLYLFQAQMRCNELWALNFSLIDSKYGWVRSSVLGGEFNYSGQKHHRPIFS